MSYMVSMVTMPVCGAILMLWRLLQRLIDIIMAITAKSKITYSADCVFLVLKFDFNITYLKQCFAKIRNVLS